jgi:hypothetical protein
MMNPEDVNPHTPRHAGLKRALRMVLGIALLVGIGIQFIPVQGVGVNPTQRYNVGAPAEVEAILRESCFDCHSNETRWPFYARLAPSSWLLIRDVKKGRAHMNFSEWGDTDEQERTLDKENSWEMVEKGEMPPWFYLPMHPAAHLDDKKKAVLKEWFMKKAPEAPKEAAAGKAPPTTPPK